jgi:hypothetical protein
MSRSLACLIVIGLSHASCIDADEALSTKESATHAGTFAGTMGSLGPLGWWRMGDSSTSTTMAPIVGGPPGTYFNSPTRGQTGAIFGDANTSVKFDGRTQYAEIADDDIFSLTKAWDGFNRNPAISGGWGQGNDGQWWVNQVSTIGTYYNCDSNNCYIDPHGVSGTFQQGRTQVYMVAGEMQVRAKWNVHANGGALQPVALVAQRIDNANFIRAELLENPDLSVTLKLIKTVNGTSAPVAQKRMSFNYNVNEWVYVRFKFNGNDLNAKAWKSTVQQPNQQDTLDWNCTDCVHGIATGIANPGNVAIRSANSVSLSRPKVTFEGFWTQSIGMTIHTFVKVPPASQAQNVSYAFAKGTTYGSSGNQEYELRFHEDSDLMKAYVFDRAGGYGTGNAFAPIRDGVTFHEVVFQLDPGDALDSRTAECSCCLAEDCACCGAGMSLWVDGQFKGRGMYEGITDVPIKCTTTADCAAAGLDPAYYCDLETEWRHVCTQWMIYPFNYGAPFRVATKVKSSDYFAGHFDELAVFNYKLTRNDIVRLYESSK